MTTDATSGLNLAAVALDAEAGTFDIAGAFEEAGLSARNLVRIDRVLLYHGKLLSLVNRQYHFSLAVEPFLAI